MLRRIRTRTRSSITSIVVYYIISIVVLYMPQHSHPRIFMRYEVMRLCFLGIVSARTFGFVYPRNIDAVQGLHGARSDGWFVVVAIELETPCLQQQADCCVGIVWNWYRSEVVAVGRKYWDKLTLHTLLPSGWVGFAVTRR